MRQFASATTLWSAGWHCRASPQRVGRRRSTPTTARCWTPARRELRAALPREISLHYAMKANPMPALVAHMARPVDGIDVASGAELRVALDVGHGSGRHQLRRSGQVAGRTGAGGCLGHPDQCRVESRGRRCWRACRGSSRSPARVAVRVNPDFELKSSGMKMGGGPKQFGVDVEDVPRALLSESAS